MTTPTKTQLRFTAQQKAEAVELCLQEGLSGNAVAQRLGLPSSSLARWVRQALNSSEVSDGIKTILLNHTNLAEQARSVVLQMMAERSLGSFAA